MAKFKPGDKVIVKCDLRYNDYTVGKADYPQIGEVVTVKEIKGGDWDRGPIYWFKEKPNGRYEKELELEALYNSPLYMAMK